MDLNYFTSRGKSWMGDFRQKVEDVFQEVDGIMKQDKKIQRPDLKKASMISVDDFSSDVVQGLHPRVNPLTSNDKAPATDESAYTSISKPFVNVEDKVVQTHDNQLKMEPTISKSSLNHVHGEPYTVNQLRGIAPVPEDPVKDELGKTISQDLIDNGLTKEHVEMIVDLNIVEDKSAAPEMEPASFNANNMSVKFLVGNVEDTLGSLASSVRLMEDHIYQNSNAVSDQFHEETEGLSSPSSAPPWTSAVKSSEVAIAEMGTKSSSDLQAVTSCSKSCNVPESSFTKVGHHDDLIDAGNCKFDILPRVPPFPSSASERNVGADIQMTRSVDSHKKDHLHISSDNSVDDPINFGMETVDLNDEVKLEGDGAVINARELYAVSHRVQKLQSFRKRIHNAFTSKRRLAKEYEQLAIWYGDIEIDCPNQYRPQDPPLALTTLSNSESPQKHQSSESEWVIL